MRPLDEDDIALLKSYVRVLLLESRSGGSEWNGGAEWSRVALNGVDLLAIGLNAFVLFYLGLGLGDTGSGALCQIDQIRGR